MRTSSRHFRDLAASAHQLQRAAGFFQQHASAPDSVADLPVALAHVEEALDRLSAGINLAAHAVDDPALRWHLFHLASRLKGSQESCVEPRRFARTLLEREAPSAAAA